MKKITCPLCPVERTIAVIGGKWTMIILRDLFAGIKRFGELRSSIGNISPKILSQRLRYLEKKGIIRRKIYPEVPPKVEYTLTARGRSLSSIVDKMREWGEEQYASPKTQIRRSK